MWTALAYAAPAVARGGKLFIAIYNDQGTASSRWTKVKKLYHQKPQPLRQLVVQLFDLRPAAAGRSLIVVNGDKQLAAAGHCRGRICQRRPHVSRVVQHPPGIDDVEFSQGRDIAGVQCGPRLNDPVVVIGEVAAPQFFGAADRIGVVIERMHTGTESSGSQAEQPTPRTNIKKALAGQTVSFQHVA